MSAKLKLVDPDPFSARAYAADYLKARRLKAETAIIYVGLYSVYPRPERVIEQRQREAVTGSLQCSAARLSARAARRSEEVEQASESEWGRVWKWILLALGRRAQKGREQR